MTKTVFQSQLEDAAAVRGLMNEAESLRGATEGVGAAGMSPEDAIESIRSGEADLNDPNPAEAIVMLTGYPSLLIRNGDYEDPKNGEWKRRLDPHRRKIRNVIANSGRVDLVGNPDYQWVGTAWRINEDTFLTNRHVAVEFARARAGGFAVKPGMKAFVDLLEEFESEEQFENFVSSVVHIEPHSDSAIDAAILRVDKAAARGLKGEPIAIRDGGPAPEFIGVVGYPAKDWRNPQGAMRDYFQDIYNKKRLAPGRIMNWSHSASVLTHNATTLGGNSGSVVFDLATGCAVGLHFAGNAQLQNYAVNGKSIADLLRRRSVHFSRCAAAAGGGGGDAAPGHNGAAAIGGAGAPPDERSEEDWSDRDGYRPDFIGEDALVVPLPQLNARQRRKVAKTRDGEEILNYRHFSVVMNKQRRLAFFAAANIDGTSLKRPPRKNKFYLDPRLDDELQAGEALYADNDFDRGHLVRRLDPVWGSDEDARQANVDSMYFPNIAPQHKDLNQKIWAGLEDHILDRTDDENARVSVFVGCIFSEDDPPHAATGLKVPLQYWKVVASSSNVKRGRFVKRELQAQAFVMTQEDLVSPGDFELIFGRGYEVYQVAVEDLEKLTGLDFDALREADTFGTPPERRAKMTEAAARNESPSQSVRESARPIADFDDIVM